MSSEYSSPGDDSDLDDDDPSMRSAHGAHGVNGGDGIGGVGEKRRDQWAEMLMMQPAPAEGSKGWAEGAREKVLEVRTPRWRASAVRYTALCHCVNRLGVWASRSGWC